MDHNISHRKHFRPRKLRVSFSNFFGYMPRRFSNNLEIAQNGINGFLVTLEITEAIALRESPNFEDTLQDISDPYFPISRWHGLLHAEFPPAVPAEVLLVSPNPQGAQEFPPDTF